MINNTTISTSIDTAATGRTSSNPFVDQFLPRDPTPQDVQYPVQKKWLNTTKGTFWELQNFITSNGVVTANWIKIGSVGLVETLTGNDLIVVPATNNNINVVGDGVYIQTTGNAATSTLTISPAGGLTTLYTCDTGTATPSSGNLNVFGLEGIATAGSGNTITIDFVGGDDAIESIAVDAHTNPGTNPVLPNSGQVTITGGQVAAGTTTNVIRTDSLAANTFTVEVQRSQAVASTTVGDNGVSHFNSAQFTVDTNAFVSLVHPGITPVAFFAYVSANVDNVTGDSTTYTVLYDTKVFDLGSNYNTGTGTFTAPVNGVYTFSCTVSMYNLGAGHNQGDLDMHISGQDVHGNTGDPGAEAGAGGKLSWVNSIVYQMSAGQTISTNVAVSNSTKTVGIQGASGFAGIYVTSFSGAQLY